jgi:hypothetical protein
VPVVVGSERASSTRAELWANAPAQQYKAIKLKDDVRGVSIVGIGDLNGDGVYDFVVKHPAGGKDPGHVGPNRGSYKYDGYDGATGEFLWRIDLGWNVDMGIWWTPMVVRDLDGDNKAEVCVRTAPYAADADEMFPSGRTGFILEGPEYLAVYDGATGAVIDKVDWIERGRVQDWADNTRQSLQSSHDGRGLSGRQDPGGPGGSRHLRHDENRRLGAQGQEASEGLALDQRAGSLHVPGAGPAQHQDRRHRRRRLR